MPAAKGLIEKRDIISPQEIEELLNKSIGFSDAKEFRSLTAFLYITGARIREALELTKKDFNMDNHYVYIRVKTLKTTDAVPYRTLQIGLETQYLDIILDRLFELGENDKLWNIHYRTYLRRLQSVIPNAWTHLFRHTRMTKFAEKKYNEFQLQAWAGWADSRPAKKYVRHTAKLTEGMGKDIE